MENAHEITELTLEEVMGDRFGRYSKYIIQERALPDIRDGLKPVQRRILFAMNQDGNTFDKAFRKSAKSVGNVMGNFHPHGDSSIYEAMVRMSQDWKLREPLIEMHGNNGSMDGDPPAAMRYTEARLSKLAAEMLQDIDKETVDFVLNFDDTEEEPTVLPARFPNLLINGASGISAGYATEIPTHNLGEVIDATIYLMDHPEASLEKLMTFVPGPDFPTGGILQGIEGVKQAYETGKGRIVVRSKTEIEELRGNKTQIVIHEVPYEVNKAMLVKKMDEIRIMKKVDGIAEVRDESDRTGLRIVVELKKDVDAQGILNYLFKNTDLQITYNFNMVAIDQKRPKQVGLIRILEAYVAHQKEVVTRRTQFSLKKAKARIHIVEGLIYALSILDKVIATIRSSKDKKSAKENLMKAYEFTEKQAEAIVSLQLYRLTNTDVTALEAEQKELNEKIAGYQAILGDETVLVKVLKKELQGLKKAFASPRLTQIQAKIEEIKIETEILIAKEDVMVIVTHDSYLKRSSMRSYQASGFDELGMKDGDYPVYLAQLNTLEHLFMFTNKGHVIYRPIHEIPDIRWKDLGEHLSQTIGLDMDEEIIFVTSTKQLDEDKNIVLISKEGMIKQTKLADLAPGRSYKNKASQCMKLKTATDLVTNVFVYEQNAKLEVFLTTHRGFALRYDLAEVPVTGAKAAGVKAINLKADDFVVNGTLLTADLNSDLLFVTQRGAVKKMHTHEIPLLGRAKRGLMVLRELKKNPHRIIYMQREDKENNLCQVITDKGKQFTIDCNTLKPVDRYSNGHFMLDEENDGQPILVYPLLTIKEDESNHTENKS